MSENRTVYVIDDEEAVRDSVALLLEARGLMPQSFASGAEFLKVAPGLLPGCVVTDMRMPGIDGLELLQQLRQCNLPFPAIVMTGHGEVPLAVKALKAGAVDFIEKPFAGDTLIEAVLSALQKIEASSGDANTAEINDRIASLTPREREVLDQLVAGNQNKMIAHHLGMSPRTVEVHRARVMEKMRARSLSALVRMAIAAGRLAIHDPS